MIKSIFVAIKIKLGDSKVSFDNNSILNKKKIKHILTDNSISVWNGQQIVPDNFYLILKENGKELFYVSKAQTSYGEYHRLCFDTVLDIEQCEIHFFEPSAYAGVILLNVHYED